MDFWEEEVRVGVFCVNGGVDFFGVGSSIFWGVESPLDLTSSLDCWGAFSTGFTGGGLEGLEGVAVLGGEGFEELNSCISNLSKSGVTFVFCGADTVEDTGVDWGAGAGVWIGTVVEGIGVDNCLIERRIFFLWPGIEIWIVSKS